MSSRRAGCQCGSRAAPRCPLTLPIRTPTHPPTQSKAKMLGKARFPLRAVVQEGRIKDKYPLMEAQVRRGGGGGAVQVCGPPHARPLARRATPPPRTHTHTSTHPPPPTHPPTPTHLHVPTHPPPPHPTPPCRLARSTSPWSGSRSTWMPPPPRRSTPTPGSRARPAAPSEPRPHVGCGRPHGSAAFKPRQRRGSSWMHRHCQCPAALSEPPGSTCQPLPPPPLLPIVARSPDHALFMPSPHPATHTLHTLALRTAVPAFGLQRARTHARARATAHPHPSS